MQGTQLATVTDFILPPKTFFLGKKRGAPHQMKRTPSNKEVLKVENLLIQCSQQVNNWIKICAHIGQQSIECKVAGGRKVA